MHGGLYTPTVRYSTLKMGLPNIIILLTDDQGWSDVSYAASYAHQPGAGGVWKPNPPRTPHLDEMASSDNSLSFLRFYAGSAVCSPTRSAILTGRAPSRDCINGAEGCGQEPAWSCADKLPLPPLTFTMAEAARSVGMATFHGGKWHLGDFFPMNSTSRRLIVGKRSWTTLPLSDDPGGYAYQKWPVSTRCEALNDNSCLMPALLTLQAVVH